MREKCNVTGDEMELATSLSASEFRDHHQCINLEFASNSFFFWGGVLITAISKSFHIKQINDSYWEAKCWQIFLSQLHKVLQFNTKFELSTCMGLL